MQKVVILCEGKKDSEFLREILNILGKKAKIFDQNERYKIKNLKFCENREFNKFLQNTSPYSVLVKSEAGKQKAIKLLVSILDFLIDNNLKTILLLDLDGSTLNNLEKKINDCVRRNNYNLSCKKTKQVNNMINCKVKIYKSKKEKEIYDLDLVLFANSLEKELEVMSLNQLVKKYKEVISSCF
ncbi:MAG TPA: hypothetical protein PK103_05555 [Elusimicrobiales bacterium]|nr:hypothetical protein [Elusimicrobiales bacterium]HOL62813.1 hypothetical protein [Elusimicrobiales bacterium]HPO95751.1 hypothetical protein [Elusimicrobiales bacterium]